MQELKPCPLCGGRGVLYDIGKEGCVIQCENCGLTTPKSVKSGVTETRICQMWNGKVRLKTWSKAVMPWMPWHAEEERDFAKGTLDYQTAAQNIPIERLDITVRLFNRLRYSGIKTIGDILLKTPDEVKDIRNLGIKQYRELLGKLESILEKDVYIKWLKKGEKI